MYESLKKIGFRIVSVCTILVFVFMAGRGVLYAESLSAVPLSTSLQVELFFREDNLEEGLLGYLSLMARAVPVIENFKYPIKRLVNGNDIVLNFRDTKRSGPFLIVSCSVFSKESIGGRFYEGVIDLRTKDVFLQDFIGQEEVKTLKALEGFSKSIFHSDYEKLIYELGGKALSRQAAVLLKSIYDKDISVSIKKKVVNSLVAIAGRTHYSVTQDLILDLIEKEEYPDIYQKLILFSVYHWGEEVLNSFKGFAKEMKGGDKQMMIERSVQVLSELQKEPICLNDGFTLFWNKIKNRKSIGKVRAIDIGSGAGDFIRKSKKHKWGRETDIIGVDESEDMVRFAVLYTIAETYKQKWHSIDNEDGFFDLITFNFPSPNVGWGSLKSAFMESYRICSDDGGFAFCSTGDPEDGFDKERVIEILKKIGFENIVFFEGKDIPFSYPRSGTHLQLEVKAPEGRYLILADKRSSKDKSKVSSGSKMEEHLYRQYDYQSELVVKFVENIFSGALSGKKTVLAFDIGLSRNNACRSYQILDHISRLKKDPKFKKVLKDLYIIRAAPEKIPNKIEEYLENDSEIFLFTREEENIKKVVRSVIDRVHFFSVDEKNFEFNVYYPFLEIITIALTSYVSPAELKDFEGLLHSINIEEIIPENGGLIFRLLPEAKAVDPKELVNIMARIKRILKSA